MNRRLLLFGLPVALILLGVAVVAVLLVKEGAPTPTPTEAPAPIPPTATAPVASPEAGVTETQPAATRIPGSPGPTAVSVEVEREGVSIVEADGQRREVDTTTPISLPVGSGVAVDESGGAMVRVPGVLTVEVLPGGQVVLQEMTGGEQPVTVTLLQLVGAILAWFDRQATAAATLRVEIENAVVEVTGGQVLIVKQAESPLEWVIALEGAEGDVQIIAVPGAEPQPVAPGTAVSVAPSGETSAPIPVDHEAVDTWLDNLRQGTAQPAIDEVLGAEVAAPVAPVSQPEPLARPSPPRPTSPAVPAVCTTIEAGLNLRAGPGVTYDILDRLDQGVTLAARGRSTDGNWIAVRTPDGSEGWVALSYLSCPGIAAALPDVSPPGPPPPACVPEQPAGWGAYQVVAGDTLVDIATRSGTTVVRLKEVNCLLSDTLLVDDILFVPAAATPTPVPTETPEAMAVTTPTRGPEEATPSAQPTQAARPVASVEGLLPDLVVTDLRPVGLPRVEEDGQIALPMRTVIKNRGAAPAGVFKVSVEYQQEGHVFVVPFTRAGQMDPWYPFSENSLPPGQSLVLVGTLTFDASLQGRTVDLVAIADSCRGDIGLADYCRVQESNEGNNVSASTRVTLPN